jgi:hypothetical protein
MRLFLANMFIQYRIGPTLTRVALVTFDGAATTVFRLNTYTNWNDLYQAIGNSWQYGPASMHTADRNLNE